MRALGPPDTRRVAWVRLVDVDQNVRVRAAEALIRREHLEPEERLELMVLAVAPPPQAGGWVTADAVRGLS
jgi:hypothetical protein